MNSGPVLTGTLSFIIMKESNPTFPMAGPIIMDGPVFWPENPKKKTDIIADFPERSGKKT